jgi:hypothetical protein
MLRAEADVFGPVACDLTVSHLIDTLAAAGPNALKKTYGHHPMMGFVDHGSGGSQRPKFFKSLQERSIRPCGNAAWWPTRSYPQPKSKTCTRRSNTTSSEIRGV